MSALRTSLLLVLCVVVTVSSVGTVAAATLSAPAAADGPNLLANPGFESPYAKQCCHTSPAFPPGTPIDEVQVAAGWSGWWLEPDQDPYHPGSCENKPGCNVAWHRPEWREAACGSPCADRVRSGGNAQKYFTFFSVHDAGMYQRAGGVAPGQRVRFSIYMQGWTTHSNYGNSDFSQSMGMRIGIDPFGGTNPYSGNVQWSAPNDVYDTWGLYAIEAVARAGAVTVFTRSTPNYGFQHNDIYLDDASLVVVGAGPANPNPVNPTTGPNPTVAAPPTQVTGLKYVVVPGDNYYRIARRFGVSVSSILLANPTATPNLLKVGQVLIIPGVTSVPAATVPAPAPTAMGPAAPTATVAPPANAFTYVVQRGDNLFRLSLRFNTTVQRIKQLNNLVSDIIFIGQTLIIAP
jgi:LysM repeat protein